MRIGIEVGGVVSACAVNPGPSTQIGSVGLLSKQDRAGLKRRSFSFPPDFLLGLACEMTEMG